MEIRDSEEERLVRVAKVPRYSVIEFNGGELGYIVMHKPGKHQTVVHLAGRGIVKVSDEVQVGVVAEPDDLAFAYVERPAMRPMVHQTMMQAQGKLAQTMNDILYGRRG